MTEKQRFQQLAREIGHHFPPAHYRNEIKRRTKGEVEVSPANVTRAIGSYSSRLKANEPAIMKRATALLSECCFDHHLACAMVNKAFVSA